MLKHFQGHYSTRYAIGVVAAPLLSRHDPHAVPVFGWSDGKFLASAHVEFGESPLLRMLKKTASGVLALLPNLRAHRLAALRGVRAHVREYAPRVKRAAAFLDGLF